MKFKQQFTAIEDTDIDIDEADLERLHKVGITSVEELAEAIKGSPESIAYVLEMDDDRFSELAEEVSAWLSPEADAALSVAPEKYATGAYPPHAGYEPVDEPTSIKKRDGSEERERTPRARHLPEPS